MTAQTFDFFKFYEDYLWTHANFETFQDSGKKYSEAGFREAFKEKVIKGLGFAGSLNYDITVDIGGAVDSAGRVLSLTSQEDITPAVTPDVSNGVYSLLVIRRKVDLINLIDEPLNPTNQVPLNERQSSELVVVDGTPAVNPVYPAKQAGDVILFGLKMPLNTSSFTSAMVDYSVSEYIGPNEDLLKSIIGYDAVVSKSRGGTHQSLPDLIADANFGSTIKKVVILDSEQIENITITQDNVEIDIRKGVTLSKGVSATGMTVEGDGVTIKMARIIDFNGGSDHAIVWRGEYGHLLFSRFRDCDNEYTDETTNGLSVIGSHTEA